MSFAGETLEVREGESAEIAVRYQVAGLDAPWRLVISPLPESASTDDFELSNTTIEIPAAQGVSGEALLDLTAVVDAAFDEGDETLALRFVPAEGVNAQLGDDLHIAIQDAGVSPCPGVTLVATRPARVGLPLEGGGFAEGGTFVRRFLTMRLNQQLENLPMEFAGPYWDFAQPQDLFYGLPYLNTPFALHIESWDFETNGDVIEHQWDLLAAPVWRPDGYVAADPDLRLAFHGGGCRAAVARCSLAECVLME